MSLICKSSWPLGALGAPRGAPFFEVNLDFSDYLRAELEERSREQLSQGGALRIDVILNPKALKP